jgi:hypothetical protein
LSNKRNDVTVTTFLGTRNGSDVTIAILFEAIFNFFNLISNGNNVAVTGTFPK